MIKQDPRFWGDLRNFLGRGGGGGKEERKKYLARSHEERLDKLRGVKELIVEGMECIICC
jgi:hypothetical protein